MARFRGKFGVRVVQTKKTTAAGFAAGAAGGRRRAVSRPGRLRAQKVARIRAVGIERSRAKFATETEAKRKAARSFVGTAQAGGKPASRRTRARPGVTRALGQRSTLG